MPDAADTSDSEQEMLQQQTAASSEEPESSVSQSEALQQSSMPAQEEDAKNYANDSTGFVKEDQRGLYTRIDACTIKNNLMTIVFSAYAENPMVANATMDVWLSNDNSAGQIEEEYAIHKLKEYTLSMSSEWFDEDNIRGSIYEVFVTISATTHRFYFDGENMFS